jgi:hypothetical protein
LPGPSGSDVRLALSDLFGPDVKLESPTYAEGPARSGWIARSTVFPA